MSDNTSTPADFADYVRLTHASHWIYRVWTIGFLLVGVLGNTIALMIFLRWANRLSIYIYLTFLCLVNTLVMLGDMQYHYLLPFLIDSTAMTKAVLPVTCKCMLFLTYFFRYLFIWLLVAVNVDRCLYLTGDGAKARVCRPRVARIVCCALLLFTFAANSHFLMFKSAPIVRNNTLNEQCYLQSFYSQCESSNGNHRYFMKRVWPIYNLLLFGIIPCFITFLCCVLMIRKIRSTRREGRESSISNDKRCRSFVKTLLCLDLLFPLTIFPALCFYLYLHYHPPRTCSSIGVVNLISSVGVSITFTKNAFAFVIFYLTGSKFRRAFAALVHRTNKSTTV